MLVKRPNFCLIYYKVKLLKMQLTEKYRMGFPELLYVTLVCLKQ